MAEVITLSSEDEEVPAEPAKKRLKLFTLLTKPEEKIEKKVQEDSCIVLLDDDDEEENKDSKLEKGKSEENGSSNNVDAVKVLDDKKADKKEGVVENGVPGVASVEPDTVDEDDKKDTSSTPMELENNNVKDKFDAFVKDSMKNLENSQHKSLVESKLPIIRKLYEKITKHNDVSEELIELLENSRKNIIAHPKETVIYFSDVYKWLKSTYKETTEARKTSEHNQKIIKKLEKTLLKIRKKIRSLESAEIDFQDEENSSYLQMDRYMNRASQIYSKLCKYRQENPRHGCLLYCRLDFSSSKYSEINKAVNKKYKNNQVFPSYYDLDKCIRQCVEENKLKISPENLKSEVGSCFKALGQLLQRRRQRDLYNNQRSYIENTTDPANENPEIGIQIAANKNIYDKKLDELMEKYTRLQDKGVNPDISSESEDSNVGESDSEHDENITENV